MRKPRKAWWMVDCYRSWGWEPICTEHRSLSAAKRAAAEMRRRYFHKTRIVKCMVLA